MTSDRYQVRSDDGRLETQFVWNGDRFSHQFVVDGQVLGRTVEGDADADWPPSPPIQQLSNEWIDGQAMILGVGAAGRSHWSISARPCPDDEAAIQFDLACRCKDTPGVLGSQYSLQPQLSLQIIDGQVAKDAGPDASDAVIANQSLSSTTQWSYRVALPQ